MEEQVNLADLKQLTDFAMSRNNINKGVENYRSKLKGKSINNMSPNDICKLMGYSNLKQFLMENPLESASGKKPSKKHLIELYKTGHTNKDSLTGLLMDVQKYQQELEENEKQ